MVKNNQEKCGLSRKQLLLLAFIILISLLAGLLPSPETVSVLFKHTAYYFIFITVFLWVLVFCTLYLLKLKRLVVHHYAGILISAVAIVLIFHMSPPKVKILADEANLAGTAMSLYQNKTASIPLKGFCQEYKPSDYTSKIDKKPILFPLLVSFIHTLLGYSASNGFIVNFFSGFLCLFVLYLFVSRYFSRFYGILSVMILASLPIFVVWVTSSGCEALNLLFILLAFYMFGKLVQNKKTPHAELFFLTLVLLAQCRFESIAFTVALLLILPVLYKQKILYNFSLILYLIPVLYIPFVWQPRLYMEFPDINKMVSAHGEQLFVQTPSLYHSFSFTNLFVNTTQNMFIFLGFDPHLGFSFVVSILAISGVYLMFRRLILLPLGELDSRFIYMALYGTVSFTLLYCILFSFYMGDLSIATQNRFALAFVPCMVIPLLYWLHRLQAKYNSRFHINILICLMVVFHLLYLWPYGARQIISNRLAASYEYNTVVRYINSKYKYNKNLLIISDKPNYYLIHYSGSVDFSYAKNNKKKISNELIKQFDQILVLQRCFYTKDAYRVKTKLDGIFNITEIKRFNITPAMFVILSELK